MAIFVPWASAQSRSPHHPSSTVDHWGAYFESKGITDIHRSPTSIKLPGTVKEVATSNSTEYALLTNGRVYAWGLGKWGQLGDGSLTNSLTVPRAVQFPPGVVIASLPTDAMPFDTGLALDTSGHAWGWGRNTAGQLCLGNTSREPTPVQLPFTDVSAMAGGGDHALYESNRTVYACGNNQHGDLGDGGLQPSSVPAVVSKIGHRRVVALVAAFNDSGALLSDGSYFDWGYNADGQVGIGKAAVTVDAPREVSLPHPVVQVVEGGGYLGNGQTLVMLTDGSLWSWGDNKFGQLGTGGTTSSTSPLQFYAPTGVTYVALATGADTSYGVTTDGDVYSWGGNEFGQIGDGGTTSRVTPVLVESEATLVSSTADNVVVGP